MGTAHAAAIAEATVAGDQFSDVRGDVATMARETFRAKRDGCIKVVMKPHRGRQ